MVTRIDAFTHILPRRFLTEMAATHSTAELDELSDADFMWDIDKRLTDMADFGIDKQVLTLARPTIWRGMDAEAAIELTRVANDEVYQIAAEHPDHFIPVATLPSLDGPFLDELDRCLDDLTMAGVQIFSNVDGRPLDDDAFVPFFETIDRRGVPIWIHPQLFDWYDWIDEYFEHKALGWPFDTSIALSRLVMGGHMEEFDLDIIPHHGAGMIPHHAERLQTFYEAWTTYSDVYPRATLPDLSDPVEEYYRSFYADTAMSGGTAALDCVLEFFGADQVVFATDYPFGPDVGRRWLDRMVSAIESKAKSAQPSIFGENLQGLLN